MGYVAHSFTFSEGQKKSIMEFMLNEAAKLLKINVHHSCLTGPDRMIIPSSTKAAINKRINDPNNKRGIMLKLSRKLMKQNRGTDFRNKDEIDAIVVEKKQSGLVLDEMPAVPYMVTEAKRMISTMKLNNENETSVLNKANLSQPELEEKLIKTIVQYLAEKLGEHTKQDLYSELPETYRSMTFRPRILIKRPSEAIEFFL